MSDVLRKMCKSKKACVHQNLASSAHHSKLILHLFTFRGHRYSATCVALSDDDTWLFSGSKDRTILHFDVTTGK